MKPPVVDYKSFRLHKINQKDYRHIKWLLFWPVFFLLFTYLERFYPVDSYYPVDSPLDGFVPFNEWFLFPYLFWFLYQIVPLLYSFLYDTSAFTHLMKYIALTYSVALLIYFFFPTCQNLRPESFARDNLLTRFISVYYVLDTNTNVCPSLHAIGAIDVTVAALKNKRFHSLAWRIGFIACGMLISLSTVFLKQHSVLDVLAALPVCFMAYPFCFKKEPMAEASPLMAHDKGKKEKAIL